jgi:esterase
MLNLIDHKGPENGPPLLIAHGLYGSARNWGVICKRLSKSRRVIAVDHRNHGASPWFETNTYEDLAGDLAEVIGHLGGPCDVLGHSMGGKAAMVLAHRYPNLVNRLCVADIAPVSYCHDQTQFIKAMKAVDLSLVEKRADVKDQLARFIEDEAVQNFFTQSVDVKSQGWRLNLDVLSKEMSKIIGFPDLKTSFEGSTLFLSGGKSVYVKMEMRVHIQRLFPAAKFAKIPRAGHWIHAERPRELEAVLSVFFGYGS